VLKFADQSWHRDVAAQAVAPVVGVRGLDSSCSSATGGSAACRDRNFVAPAPSSQLTS